MCIKYKSQIFSQLCLLMVMILFSWAMPPLTQAAEGQTPNFTLDTLQGPFTLSEYRGTPLVLFFSFPG